MLNDVVWAPSYSLLRIVNKKTLMIDWDMGEMFHNFQLHDNTVLATGVDLALLQFMAEECGHWYMCWQRNLMGFRSLPYNCIQVSLVIEEVIRGNRYNLRNSF